jgi:aldehyde:ferredoxin oxidoreductase
MKGYAGKYLEVDLGRKQYAAKELSEELARSFIGGFGLAAYTLYKGVPKGVDPFSPENVVCWWTGPFAGTLSHGCKYVAGTKSPLTGIIGFGICSGSFGPELKYAGWDGVVVKGKAERPTYLFIDDDYVEFRDAAGVWGKDAWAAEDLIKEELGDERVALSIIGTAGEKLVRFACINTDKYRQVGRCGVGAVVGSKNLKAVAVRGHKGIDVADLDKLVELSKGLIEASQGPKTEKYRRYGTMGNVLALNALGALPTRNFQQGTFEHAEEVSGERIHKDYLKKVKACHGCSIGCDHMLAAHKGTKYEGTVASTEYESLGALGPNCGVWDVDAIIKAVNYCEAYGADTISTGLTVSWAMECYERGILTKDDTDGLDLRFGNGDAMVEAVRKLCTREGKLGNLLAEGTRRASGIVGKGAINYAIQIKGLEYGLYSMRSLQTATLGFATCVTGAFYQRSGSYQYDTKGKVDRYKLDKTRGKLVADGENEYSIIDSLIVCKFARDIYNMDRYAELYTLITGMPMSSQELTKTGERIYNLAKCFNIREANVGRKDDYPPPRAFEPMNDDVNKGVKIKKEEFDEALDSYYDVRGWDREGRPSKEKLRELGLDRIVEG